MSVGNKVGAADQELPAVKTTLAQWPEGMESWELASLLQGLMHMSDKEADAGCAAYTSYIASNKLGSDEPGGLAYECKAIVNANGKWPFAKSDIVRLARVTVTVHESGAENVAPFEIVVVTAPKSTAEIFALFFDSLVENTGLYDNVISEGITKLAFGGEHTVDEWKAGTIKDAAGSTVPYSSAMFDLLIGYSYGASFVKDMFKNRQEGSVNSSIDPFSSESQNKTATAGKFGKRTYYPELSHMTRTAIFNPYLTSVVRTENPLVEIIEVVLKDSFKLVIQLLPHALAWAFGAMQNAAASDPQTAAFVPLIKLLGDGVEHLAQAGVDKLEGTDPADEKAIAKWGADFKQMIQEAQDKPAQSKAENEKFMNEQVSGFLDRVKNDAGLSGDVKTQIEGMVSELWVYMSNGEKLRELFDEIYPNRFVKAPASGPNAEVNVTLDLNIRMAHDAVSACGGSGLSINLGGMEALECDGKACSKGQDLADFDGEKILTNANGTPFQIQHATRYSLFADQNKISTIADFLKDPVNAEVYSMQKMSQEDANNTFNNGTNSTELMWTVPMSCCDTVAEDAAELLDTWIDTQASAFCTDYAKKHNCDAYYWDAEKKYGSKKKLNYN